METYVKSESVNIQRVALAMSRQAAKIEALERIKDLSEKLLRTGDGDSDLFVALRDYNRRFK